MKGIDKMNMNTSKKNTSKTNNNEYDSNKPYRYVYNLMQASHYISECGVVPVKVDKHHKTKRIFYVFEIDEKTDIAFESWLNSKRV